MNNLARRTRGIAHFTEAVIETIERIEKLRHSHPTATANEEDVVVYEKFDVDWKLAEALCNLNNAAKSLHIAATLPCNLYVENSSPKWRAMILFSKLKQIFWESLIL